MAGKGPQLRKGANLKAYWDNFPFAEKQTVTQWKNKLFGNSEFAPSDTCFADIPAGTKISEDEFYAYVSKYSMTEKDHKEKNTCAEMMSHSEFQKFQNKANDN